MPPPPPIPATSWPPEASDFDFLLGEWETRSILRAKKDAAVLRGLWRAEARHQGRIIVDDYTTFNASGEETLGFVTLRTWSSVTGRWEMTFLTAGLPLQVSSFGGHRVGQEIHLVAEPASPQGGATEAKVRFFDVSDNHFNWEQLLTTDGGASWTPLLSISAERIR